MIRTFNLLLTSVILSSCLGPKWISETRPAEFLHRDISNCEIYAHERFPPSLYNTQKTSYKDIGMQRSKHLSNSNMFAQNSSSAYKISVPYTETVTEDANQQARKHAFEQCMIANEWRKNSQYMGADY